MAEPPERPPVVICTSDPRRLTRVLGTSFKHQDRLDLPTQPWDLSARRWVCTVEVETADDAARIVEALTRGVAVIARIGLSGPERHHLLEDLHRLGSVRDGEMLPSRPFALLSDPDRAMVEALAAGDTVTSVAQAMHLSRRTANRRMAGVRQALGLDTTAEVLALWARHEG